MERLKEQLCTALRGLLRQERPKVPEGGDTLLMAFLELSRARSYHTHGPNPISWEALAAWSRIMRQPLEPHHAEIIMALDAVWMEDATRRMAAPAGMNVARPSATPLSPELFDAIMGA